MPVTDQDVNAAAAVLVRRLMRFVYGLETESNGAIARNEKHRKRMQANTDQHYQEWQRDNS